MLLKCFIIGPSVKTGVYFVFDSATVNVMERTELKITVIAEQLGLSWTGKSFASCISFHYLSVFFPSTHINRLHFLFSL